MPQQADRVGGNGNAFAPVYERQIAKHDEKIMSPLETQKLSEEIAECKKASADESADFLLQLDDMQGDRNPAL